MKRKESNIDINKINDKIKRVILVNGIKIEYYFQFKQVKNLNLLINRHGEIKVSAPKRISPDIVDKFVADKIDFILKTRAKFAEFYNSDVGSRGGFTQWYNIDNHLNILGKNWQIKVVSGDKNSLRVDEDSIVIELKDGAKSELADKLLKRYVTQEAKEIFTVEMQKIYPHFAEMGIEMPGLKVRDMRSLWGSCNYRRGIITLNSRLIATDYDCIRYVIYHEFCHFIYQNHSQNFYSLLCNLYPRWAKDKATLSKYALKFFRF